MGIIDRSAVARKKKLGLPQYGRPPFANSQERKILDLLRQAGPRGVSKKFLVFDLHFTQASARVHTLEQRGFKIRHEMRAGDDYVTFVLESSPETVAQQPAPNVLHRVESTDWYERQTGKPRAAVMPEKSTADVLPLFQGVRS